jgi:hypothetical protein
MKNLLEFALEAHGGLKRWSQLKTVTADLSVTGALWQLKGQAGSLQQIRIEAELHRQKLTHSAFLCAMSFSSSGS